MIALTKEKREELIERAQDVSQRMDGYRDRPIPAITKQLMEIALASLTAEPVLYAVDSDVEDKFYTALCNENEDGAYSLFTAPPVPEIKLPEYKRNGKPLNILAERVWAECIDETKRLNGLGE